MSIVVELDEVRHQSEVEMTLWEKLFLRKPPRQRVRICVECGMPIAEHKEWCSILRGMQEREQNAARAASHG